MAADLEGSTTTNSIHQPNRPQCSFGFHWIAPWLGPQLRAADLCSRLFKRPLYCFSNSSMRVPRDALASAARSPPLARRHLHDVWTAARRPTHGASLWRLARRSAILLTMSKEPKPIAEPRTAPDRLTPQEIDELRENAAPDGRENALVAGGAEKAGGGEIGFVAQCGGLPPVALGFIS